MQQLNGTKLDNFLLGTLQNPETARAISSVEQHLGVVSTKANARVVRAIAAVAMGAPSEAIAKVLNWREFEGFCGALLRARGFEVVENINLAKPRVQVDILARSGSIALLVDCKHWGREMGPSGLLRGVSAQARRAEMLRKKMPRIEPMVVVLVCLANESARYVGEGVAVPLHTFGDFLSNITPYVLDLPRF